MAVLRATTTVNSGHQNHMDNGKTTTEQGGPDDTLYPLIGADALEVEDRIIGHGSFGSVRMGWLQTRHEKVAVALKKVFVLQKEAEILSRIRHRNIIRFYGVCVDAPPDFVLVTEFASNGSLFSILHGEDKAESTRGEEQTLKWATEIASGVHYLHYEATGRAIIHGDLKSKNVVLDENWTAKLCDFGTSKDLTHSRTRATWAGTAAWMSPEAMGAGGEGGGSTDDPDGESDNSSGLTIATDVWSYGVLVWEMLAREVPYAGFSEFKIYSIIATQGVALAIPASCPDSMKSLLTECWRRSPSKRATIKDVLFGLEQIGKSPMKNSQADWKEAIRIKTEALKRQVERRADFLAKRAATRDRLEQQLVLAEDASLLAWDEHRTAAWIGSVLAEIETPDQAKKVADSFRAHAITGGRLLYVQDYDLRSLGVERHGTRMYLVQRIRKLQEKWTARAEFPTLQQSQALREAEALQRRLSSADVAVDLVFVVYSTASGGNRLLKVLIDAAWSERNDENQYENVDIMEPENVVNSICFSFIDTATQRAVHEPECVTRVGAAVPSNWLQVPAGSEVQVRATIGFSDTVTRPRTHSLSTTLRVATSNGIVSSEKVVLHLRRTSAAGSDSSRLDTPQRVQLTRIPWSAVMRKTSSMSGFRYTLDIENDRENDATTRIAAALGVGNSGFLPDTPSSSSQWPALKTTSPQQATSTRIARRESTNRMADKEREPVTPPTTPQKATPARNKRRGEKKKEDTSKITPTATQRAAENVPVPTLQSQRRNSVYGGDAKWRWKKKENPN